MLSIVISARGQNGDSCSIRLASKLTVKGLVSRNYNVSIVYGGKLHDTVNVVSLQPKYIQLQKDKVYTIFYKREGVMPKSIIIDTQIPSKITAKIKEFIIYVNLELDPIYSKLDEDSYDFPAAILRFNEKTDNFEYAKNYHAQIHKK